MAKGIDVSSHQGTINWEEVKKNIDFAIVRCGYGNDRTNQDDNRFHQNAKQCTELGIPFGTYLYSYATNLEEAQSEVDHTLRMIQDYKLTYPVFLDVESEVQRNLSKEALTNVVEYYCQKMEEAGYYVGIYASLDWFKNRLDSPKLERFDHWLAQWSAEPTYTKLFGIWQYSSKTTMNGIVGYVDGNIAYLDYPKIIADRNLNRLDPETTPILPPSTMKYKVGDRVTFTGTLYSDSYGNGAGQSRSNFDATITMVNTQASATKPYNINNGLGWVSENDLTIGSPSNSKDHIPVGASVRILLPGRATSAGTGSVAWGIGWKRTILSYNPNAKYPYQVGNSSGTTGFYQRLALKQL